ncbi:nickel pincer cofactor biosynthesis protein LarB [Desulfohalovibrio reitneri]|uniref:nickel pincer cofactor biosynthesis protein LarB n=1 Tax=Desulfohalovibrio reitneri TaxID=1307759 RepID=UPI0004A74482|nr:nickel pincer cofactor biosynthesis protein LarB [Desulfohalovibrio reitneri]
MDQTSLKRLLEEVASGAVSTDEALARLRLRASASLAEGVTLDLDREGRCGQPEVVLGQGKTLEQIRAAVSGLADAGQRALVTRLDPGHGESLLADYPQGLHLPEARLFVLGPSASEIGPPWPESGEAMVISAGAADRAVALEALATARFYGVSAGMASDVGVSGLHRLLPHAKALTEARLHIVVAGMEGALPSVVAGLFGKPVIAVPTSVGYGTGLGGLSAVLAMLNSCAAGVAVVNVDNGFGAGAMAAKIIGEAR